METANEAQADAGQNLGNTRVVYCGIGFTNLRDVRVGGQQGVEIGIPEFPVFPASRQGLRSGDVITHYREEGEEDWKPYDSRSDASVIRGPSGTSVELKGFRQGNSAQPFEMSVQRTVIDYSPESFLPMRLDLHSCSAMSQAPSQDAPLRILGELSPLPVYHAGDELAVIKRT
jgi:hypothetical protein